MSTLRSHRQSALAAALVAVFVGGGLVSAETETATVRVLDATGDEVVLELLTPEPAPVQLASPDGPCSVMTSAGLALPSAPGLRLPTRGGVVALPSSGTVALEIIEAPVIELRILAPWCREDSAESLTASHQLGAATIAPPPDPSRAPAELGLVGILRGQPTALVTFYPLRPDLDRGVLRYHPRITLRLRVSPDGADVQPRDGLLSDALEPLWLNPPARIGGAPERPATSKAASRSSSHLAKTTTPALKLSVDRDGTYRVTPDDLATAGWSLDTLDPRNLHLEVGGAEVAMWRDGGGDGRLDAGDGLVFFGHAARTRSTRRNIYWLRAGSTPGLEMATRSVSPTHGWPEAASFPTTLRAEEEPAAGYWQNPPVPIIQDHWYWTGRLNAPASADMVFNLPPFDATGTAQTLRVLVAGRTVVPLLDPDHHTRVHLNGTPVHDAWWDGQVEHTHEVDLPAGLLVEGANTITLEAVGDTGAAVDIVQPNWLELDYRRLYRALDDSLFFAAPTAGQHRLRVTGFTDDDVVLLDVTDPSRPVRLTGATLTAAGGLSDLLLEDTASATSAYLASAGDAILSPTAIRADTPSDLRSPGNGADLVIVAHADFLDALQPLVRHREVQGLRVELVDLENVYDEFAFGLTSPVAIRDLFAHAYSIWTPPALSAALLVGDGNLDELNRLGGNLATSVPTFITDIGEVGETASDAFFARIHGDDLLPDIAVGRLPARSAAAVAAIVDKIAGYETSPPPGDWTGRLLLVADDDDLEFEQVSDAVAAARPPGYGPLEIYARDFPPGNPHDAILDALDDGAALVSYVGHGNYNRWGTWSGGGSFLTTSDVPGLTNGDRLPLVFTATCLNGYFVAPGSSLGLSEALVTQAGAGAIAAWSPSALGYPADHEILLSRFLEALPTPPPTVIGPAILAATVQAQADGIPTDLASSMVLLGDPTLQLVTPPLTRRGGSRFTP